MSLQESALIAESPHTTKRHHFGRTALIIAAVVVAVAGHWAYTYNPLALSFNRSGGEWGSYVGASNGVEASYTLTNNAGEPMATQVWAEPTGTFLVQFETEITNEGSYAVRVVAVGRADVAYPISGYRVSFYKNAAFPNEDGPGFHAFNLAGHSQRMVVVTYSQACTTNAPVTVNGQAMVDGPASLPVTYSFLGLKHTDQVPVAPFTLAAPLNC
jgi:hypothetical protein